MLMMYITLKIQNLVFINIVKKKIIDNICFDFDPNIKLQIL